MRTIGVFSGGGAHGAEKVGVLNRTRPHFNLSYGCSTGALIAPLACLGEYELLRKSYLNVTDADIFEVDPFTKTGKVRILNAIWRTIWGHKSLGDSSPLLHLIRKTLTPDMYDDLGDKCQVVRYNLAKQALEYVTSGHVSYSEFTLAMWHSANAPIAMSFDAGRLDGGLSEMLPLSRAVEQAHIGDAIKVYLCRKPNWTDRSQPVGTVLGYYLAMVSAMRKEIEKNDLTTGLLQADAKGCIVDIDWQRREVSGNALRFDPVKMKEWYNIGYTQNQNFKHG